MITLPAARRLVLQDPEIARATADRTAETVSAAPERSAVADVRLALNVV